MENKRIALIGGAGFIGHNLALKLNTRGYEPVIIDSLSVNNILSFADNAARNRKLYWKMLNSRIDLLHERNIEINIEDARNYNALSMLLGKIKPDVLIQLAAVSHSKKSNKDPHSTFDHSLRTLENALDWGRATNLRHFIYVSSSMVYGDFTKAQVTEETTCNPKGIYGTLKYSGELMVKAYHDVFDLPYTIIRPSALYGERCVSRRVGQIFIENAVQGKEIVIDGDGTDRLDFTYISDFTDGVIRVIENGNSKNEIFNMTYGGSRTIAELAGLLENNFDGIRINYKTKDKFTPDRGTLSVDKAKKLIGYQPSYPIEIGYQKYIEWYKKFWKGLGRS